MSSPPRAFAIFEALTVGLPFCAFKVIFGTFLLSSPVPILGFLLNALGAIDAAVVDRPASPGLVPRLDAMAVRLDLD